MIEQLEQKTVIKSNKKENKKNLNLSKRIDNVLKNINERNPVKLRNYTPQILVENGVKDLPMYENPSHIRKNILTKKETQKLGLATSIRNHYHGLGKELYIKIINSLDSPRVIFKNKNNKDYLILTTVKDDNNSNIIVLIEIETITKINIFNIDINRIKTVYGYDRKDPDLNKYIKNNIKLGRFTKIYEQKRT
ncbi:phage minor structural protein N-terminal domain protein [Mycoplasma sp. CAG:611]|nr:phage minor structural protein N-terminal domain protein [Mycoplasma sp. CAG:611]